MHKALSSHRLKVNAAVAAFASTILLAGVLRAQTAGDTVYFDPATTGPTPSGGSGDFSTSNFYDPSTGTDGPFVSGTNVVGNFVPGQAAVFNGAAGIVSVSSPVDPATLEVGVTSGTETFGTAGAASTIGLPAGWQLVGGGSNFQNPIKIDAGSENVVFNSNVNLGIFNHYYNGSTLSSATTGSVTFNGGIAFTNNSTNGDNVGQPGLILASSVGGAFTFNSAVTYAESAGSTHLTNPDNVPYINLNSAGSTLTLTTSASLTDVDIQVNAGTVLDQGASISSPVYGRNYMISVGGTGQYLTDTAGMTVTPNIVYVNGGGTLGGALAAETTFSGQEIVGYNNSVLNVTSAAGGRVNITGDIHSGQGNAIVKIGAGTVNLNDTRGRPEDQTGGWEIKNGTLLLNGTVAGNSTITGSGLEIDQVATGSLVANVQTKATLGGNGSTLVHVTADGANSVIAPGDSTVNSGIGTLTLSGGLAATSGATFNFDLNGAKANGFDTVAFNGSNLTLGGTVTFNFINLGGALDGGPYTVLSNFSNDLNGGSSLAAAFVLNAPTGYVATLDPSDLLPGATNLAVDFTAVAVPEPSTYAMMLGGLLALGFCVRRKLAL